eukprot:scaffold70309_cov32-Tisochrysis_lutea.AAC.7
MRTRGVGRDEEEPGDIGRGAREWIGGEAASSGLARGSTHGTWHMDVEGNGITAYGTREHHRSQDWGSHASASGIGTEG